MSNDEVQQKAAPIQSTPFEDTDAPAAKQLAPVNTDQLDWLLLPSTSHRMLLIF